MNVDEVKLLLLEKINLTCVYLLLTIYLSCFSKECDDGNTVKGDGCTDCRVELGYSKANFSGFQLSFFLLRFICYSYLFVINFLFHQLALLLTLPYAQVNVETEHEIQANNATIIIQSSTMGARAAR